MNVERMCIRNVDTARRDDSVWTVAERMHQRGVGALVIIDNEHLPIGIITDRDMVERAIVRRLDADETQIGEIMTLDPRVIYEGSSTEFALAAMRDGSCRRLPLVDHEGKLSGLVCLDDLLMKSAREMSFVEQILKSETPCGMAEKTRVAACAD